MKTSYLFIAILVCSVLGVAVGGRTAKNVFFLLAGLLATFGLFRLLG